MSRLPTAKSESFDHVETWVFDLDNTLYPARYNLFDLIDRNIRDYIARTLHLPPAEARRVQKAYFHEYGTTLRGLMLNHGVDPEAYHAYVHDIDVSRLPPSPELDRALGRLEGRKVIFTNASTRHAENVIERLGVGHHFEAVFDIAEAHYVPKPQPEAYATMVEKHRIDARGAAMVEDIARNLVPAAALGMTTVWVRSGSSWGHAGSDGAHVHHVVDDLVTWLSELVAAGSAG